MIPLPFDPLWVALPAAATDGNPYFSFVQSLLLWRRLSRRGVVDLLLSPTYVSALMADDAYPIGPKLNEAIARFAIAEFSANDVAALLASFFDGRDGSLERWAGLDDVLVESFATSEALPLPADLPATCESRDRMLQLAGTAVAADLVAVPVVCALLGVASPTLGLTGRVVIATGPREDDVGVPLEVDATVNVVAQCEGLVERIEAASLLDRLVECNAIAVLGDVYALRVPKAHSVRVQTAFGADLRRHGFCSEQAKARKMLRALEETICDLNLADTHGLRESAAPGSPQASRGSDAGWRRMVDNEFRIHYWLCSDGVIELSRCGPHNMFEIDR